MQRYLFAALACLLAPTLLTAGDVIDLVPDDAHGYVVIADAAKTDAKVQAVGQRMGLPVPSFLTLMSMKLGGGNGIDNNGSLAVAVLPAEKGTSAVFYVPVKDYDAFVAQLDPAGTENGVTEGKLQNQQILVAHKGDHALITWSSRRPLLRRVLDYQAADGDQIRRASGEYDVAGVLTASGVQVVTQLGQQGLSEATRVMKERVGEDNPALAGLQLYDTLFSSAREEVAAVTLALQLDEQKALRIRENIWAKPSGKLAPMLREVPATDQDLLAGLPNIPYVMAVGGMIPEGGVQPLIDFSSSMMKSMQNMYGLDADQVDEMMNLSKKYFSDMRGMSFLLGVGEGDGPLYNEMLATIYVPNANKYLDDYHKYWEELGEILEDADESFMKDASLEEMKFGGSRVLKMTMPIPQLNNIDPNNQGEIDELMKKLYGSAEMTAYIAVGDDRTVLISYTSTDMLQKSWDANEQKQAFSSDDGVAKTTKMLPGDPLMVGYLDLGGSFAFANRFISMMPAAGGFQLPEFGQAPPIGWTMRVKPLNLEFQTAVPIETFDALGQLIGSLMKRSLPAQN